MKPIVLINKILNALKIIITVFKNHKKIKRKTKIKIVKFVPKK